MSDRNERVQALVNGKNDPDIWENDPRVFLARATELYRRSKRRYVWSVTLAAVCVLIMALNIIATIVKLSYNPDGGLILWLAFCIGGMLGWLLWFPKAARKRRERDERVTRRGILWLTRIAMEREDKQ